MLHTLDNVVTFDFLAIGSGLAGLTYALGAAESGTVAVLTKAEVAEANTSYAQGGIAAAVGEADSWELHERDTLIAGAGLCDPAAVRFLVQEAPKAIAWLSEIGARFDKEVDGLIYAQPLIVCQADVLDVERVKAHQPGRHRIDGNLIR